MLKEKEFPVYGDNGLKGTLLSASRFLDPGPERRVRLEDGRVITVPSSEAEPRQVFAPSAAGPLFREDCEVERVQVKRILDQPAEIRQDGGEKRLMLREELHIKRRREHKADSDRAPIPLDQLGR